MLCAYDSKKRTCGVLHDAAAAVGDSRWHSGIAHVTVGNNAVASRFLHGHDQSSLLSRIAVSSIARLTVAATFLTSLLNVHSKSLASW
jgi:hypothetical protein